MARSPKRAESALGLPHTRRPVSAASLQKLSTFSVATKLPAGSARKASRSAAARTAGRSVLHAAQDLVLAPLADEPVVLPRLVEAQTGEVPHQEQHEDDGDVVRD